jgi:hypothetical protein
MSKAGGLLLVMGGLAIAAYALPSSLETAAPEPAAQTSIAKMPNGNERVSQAVVAPQPQPAIRPSTLATVPSFSAPVVVTIAPRSSEPGAAPQRSASIPKDRDSLARELQKELRRVGCYEGELNGAWTPMTKRAMKAFTDRVNATLPVDEPDYILYSMVQGQQDRVCGKPCPAGQTSGEDGRCLPNAILAKATVKKAPPLVVLPSAGAQPAVSGWSTTTTATAAVALPLPPAAAPTEGRMALAGPPTRPEALLPVAPANPQAFAPTPMLPLAKKVASAPRYTQPSAQGSRMNRNFFREYDKQ